MVQLPGKIDMQRSILMLTENMTNIRFCLWKVITHLPRFLFDHRVLKFLYAYVF
jgi:hypothetical protein